MLRRQNARRWMAWLLVAGAIAGSNSRATAQTDLQPPKRPTATPSAPASPAGGAATQADLARAYLELEQAVAKRTDAPAELVRSVNQEFDDATNYFFRGDYGGAIRIIQEQTRRLMGPEKPSAAWTVGRSLGCIVDPPVFTMGSRDEIKVTLRRLYSVTTAEKPGEVKVSLEDLGGIRRDLDVVLPGNGEPAGQAVLFRATHLKPGRAKVTIRLDDHAYDLGYVDVVTESLDAQKAANAKRLEAIRPSETLAHALAVCRARNDLLTDSPAKDNMTALVVDQCELAAKVPGEIKQLEQVSDPYKNAAGDVWSVFETGGSVIPMRAFSTPVVVPQGVKAPKRPLVIAVHGAGGDENLFMNGYGAGLITRLAAARGFVVVSPRAGVLTASPAVFDAIVDTAAMEYGIDRSRVYLIGHSMGGGIVCSWAKLRADKIAGVVSIAGIGAFAGAEKLPPTLVMAAEIDGLIRPAGIEADAGKAKSQGLPVEYQLIKDTGHALAVGKALPTAVQWLLTRPAQNKP